MCVCKENSILRTPTKKKKSNLTVCCRRRRRPRKPIIFYFLPFSPFQKRALATTWVPRRTTWKTWPRHRAAVTSWVARWWSGWCPTGDRCPATRSGRCPKTKTPKNSSLCGPGPCRPWATCWASTGSHNSSNRRLSRSRSRNLDRNRFSRNRRRRPDRPRGRSDTRSSRSRTDECPRARTATKSRILSNLVQFQTWYLFIFYLIEEEKTKTKQKKITYLVKFYFVFTIIILFFN